MANIKIENLTFTYPGASQPALKSVSLDVREGELLLVIGRSGCGKSTLLRHLKTALTPHGSSEGSVLVNGTRLSDISEREQAERIGFVFQHPDDQIVTDKVWHELAFGLESLGMDAAEMRLRVAEMASYFGLENVFYKNVSELSGGQKQLLNLASVMALSPDLIVLDEPTSQLDPIAAFNFLTTVKKLNTELGITVILTEHRLEEALPFADKVAVMENGSITVPDTPRNTARNLYASHSPMFAAMPAAAKLSCELGMDNVALTPGEGRGMLLSMGLAPKLISDKPEKANVKEPVIEASELYFRYEKDEPDILKKLDFDIYAGEIYGLVGGNGAGKSTLLSVLSGARTPYRGKIIIGGQRKKGRFSAFEERIGMLSQDPRTVFSGNTVIDDLKTAAMNRGGEDAEERISDAARLMDIEDLLDRNPFDLSGGEQQRTAIAIVMLTQPRVLLLDEPTKGMDAAVKAAFGEKLCELRNGGTAILIVTHDTEFCAEFADRVGMMFDGGIVTESSTREFFCRNTFYTTAANRIARDVYMNAILTEEVAGLVREDKQRK